jgi:HEAT repeat protein
VDKFLEYVQEAPLRSVVIAHELRRQLESAPQDVQSVYSQQMWDRVKFTEQQVTPYARQELTWHLDSKNLDQQNAAVRLLERFGSKEQAEPLIKAAAASTDADFRRRAFDTATQLHSLDPAAQFDFVWEQGIANPSLRDLAVNRLRRYGQVDERASSYASLLDSIGKNDLSALARQVSRMQTDAGSELAYDYAMNMGRSLKGYQRAVALSALEEVPSLRLRALATLANQPPDYIAPTVKKFINDNNPEVAKAAREVLKGVELRTTIQEVNNILDRGGTVKPSQLEALGGSGDSNAIPSLLQIMTRGPESTRALAMDELARFDPNVVKYYARLARKGLPVEQAKHLDLVMNHNFQR